MVHHSPNTEVFVHGETVIIKSANGDVKEKELTRVKAGYKAALKKENTTYEAREHAELMIAGLEEAALESKESGNKRVRVCQTVEEQQHHRTRRIAALKAALHNDRTTEEGKERARKSLEELGAEEY